MYKVENEKKNQKLGNKIHTKRPVLFDVDSISYILSIVKSIL